MSSTIGLTQRIAEFVAAFRVSDVPADAADVARACLLDALGVACVGTAAPIASKLLGLLDLEGWSGGHTVIGSRRQTSATWAAFANAVLMHAEDFDDMPHTTYFTPALLATAEAVDASGAELLAAWVLALEVWSVLESSLATDRPFNPTGVFGPLAAAVGSAWLRDFSASQVATALGIAASHSGGVQRNFGTDTKPLDAGRSARAGVLAAQLTELGWTADECILEGWKGWAQAFGGQSADLASAADALGRFDTLTSGPGDAAAGTELDPQTWPPARRDGAPVPSADLPSRPRRGRRPVIKAWPACGRTLGALTALCDLLGEPGFDRGSIEAVDVRVGFEPRQTAVFRTDPRTGLEAKFCIPYVVAAVCLDGVVTVESFREEAFERIRASGLLGRVAARYDPELAARAGAEAAQVQLKLADGTMRTCGTHGGPGLALQGPGVVRKFLSNATPLLGVAEARQVASRGQRLEQVPRVAELLQVFARPRAADRASADSHLHGR